MFLRANTPGKPDGAYAIPPVKVRPRVTTARRAQLYGWDARTHTWHGPCELALAGARPNRLADAMANALGPSWFGPVTCCATGEPACRFFVVVHSLEDCAVALIYCEDSKAGPLEIVAAIPAERRSRLREDFAFEFLAFAGFIGALGGAELKLEEGIAAALGETPDSESLVLSLNTGLWDSHQDCVLSRCVEQTAIALLKAARKA